ncbi:TlpA family protein disulfide reductase [Olivibacter sp. SDN3]|uniref:TlpA family protein disulfide reductase n=1 Tax=Olivibacter sp. SDN3 TaxID=2764720 RepID=UPI0016516362|nr:TlpA disulfide reductase family protein [Olivibacter sp. SDN3]QNL49592.1 TlpA family protein disulfide reductase [Olivibacter sp. SDN3]
MKALVKYFLLSAVFFFYQLGKSNAQKVSLITLDQLEHRIDSGKDTVFIVNFWATWCTPCIEEIPYFQQLFNTQPDPVTKLIFVSLDSPTKIDSLVKPFIKKHHITNEVYVLNEQNQQKYIEQIDPDWSGAIPATLFITSGGEKRLFFEQSFDFQALEDTFLSFKRKFR